MSAGKPVVLGVFEVVELLEVLAISGLILGVTVVIGGHGLAASEAGNVTISPVLERSLVTGELPCSTRHLGTGVLVQL